MIIYQSNGTQRTTFDSYDYSGTHMGERKVVVTIQSPTSIDFNIGDYIDLRGEYFYLQTKPVMNRNYQTLMLTYTLTFWWTGYELGLTKFLDVVENEPDRVYYSSNNNVAFAGTIKNLLDRLIANLNRTHPVTAIFDDSWHYFIGDNVDQTVVKDIVADDLYCDAVLQFANSEFGLDFIIQPTRRILVGFTAAELNASAPLFEYGKDKGLCDINRLQNDQKVITRVYAYGAERNISQDYRIGESGHEYHPRLILPEVGEIEGTDLVCTGGYLANTALEAIYGIREDSYINDKIYPSVTLLDNTIKKVDAITDRPETETPILSRTEIVPAWIEWIPSGDMSPASYIVHPEEVRVINAVQPTYDTVTVYVDVPFDINREDILSPSTAKMSFTSGYMQGMEFEILAWEREKHRDGATIVETGLWKVTLKRNVDGNNYSLPNTNLPIQVGDEFVLLDIYLPDEYEETAEQALLEDAIAWLQARQTSPDGYSIKVPEEYIARNPADEAALVEGFPVQFKDTVIGATQQAVTIQSLSISCRDGNLPTYDLTISPTPIKGYIGRLNDRLKEASQKIATVNSITEREISSILKSAKIFQTRVLNNTWNIDGSIIESKSILPSSLGVEIRSTNYVLHAYFQVNYGGDPNVAYGSSGIMIHKDSDIVWGNVYDADHHKWTIPTPQEFALDPAKYYYVYIKGSQADGTAEWVVSETEIGTLDIDGYYMFEWGAVLGIRDGVRYSQNQYGINQVSAYVYIAYGSSIEGADFTLVNDPALRFMAIKSSATEIETPVVTDFEGLWFERIPEGGGTQVNGLGMSETVLGDMGVPSTITSKTENVLTDHSHTHKIEDISASSIIEETADELLGNLYNGIAVLDIRGIAPTGWHVPSIAEWIELISNFGDITEAIGLKLDNQNYWVSPNVGADADAPISIIGAGNRWGDTGIFSGFKDSCIYYASDYYVDGGLTYIHCVDIAYNSLATTITYPATEPYSYIRAIEQHNGASVLLVKDDDVDEGSMEDNDGNSYDTIKIGDQVWMCQNLRTISFANSDLIENVKDNDEWVATTDPAYCTYKKSFEDLTKKGQLQADWNQTDETQPDFIKNKPTLGTIASKNFWTGTQAEYDALGTYDSNTIYFIEEE